MLKSEDNLILENEILFEHFFEISSDLLCIVGFDGYFKKINPAVSKLLGYTAEELYSKPINSFIYFDDQKMTSIQRDELRKNNPLLNFENRYVTKDGQLIWISWNATPVVNQELIYAIAKNITHNKKQEEERNLLLANLTKMNNHLKKMSYASSHDLRSPINNLLSILSLLDVSKITDTETLDFIDMLKATGERLNMTFNENVDILLSEDKNSTQIEKLNFEEVLQSVTTSIGHLIKDSNTTIDSDFSILTSINFNRTYLESIFLNLITNSIKYSVPGRLPIISIYTRVTDGISQLIFFDNGLGFDMNEVKDKIFGLHQKFHNHIDSKGIGLYLVYNHITGLGGTITVESNTNLGTKFTISFKK